MAYISLTEGPFTSDLVEVDRLNAHTFNPRDYLDFSTQVKLPHVPLVSVAPIIGETASTPLGKRVRSHEVDRFTGEVLVPQLEETELAAIKFNAHDILFHKYRARIGRIGIAEFSGLCDGHFIVIRPNTIDPYYLLLALRCLPVLVQLPYRETTRPGVWVPDVERLEIPRLGDREKEIGDFLEIIFNLRARARAVLKQLLETFDKGVSSRLPTDMSFLMESGDLGNQTFDPGHYFLKAVEWTFPKNALLSKTLDVIQPASLVSGDNYAAITLKDYDFEGVKPLAPKRTDELHETNFAGVGDLIVNKLHSREVSPAKSTIITSALSSLKELGISVNVKGTTLLNVPIYSEIFILKPKPTSTVPQGYVCLFLNSRLFQSMFKFMMGGSTGRQRIRKTKLNEVKIPLLEDEQMKSFGLAVEICLETLSETMRMLLGLHQLYDNVVRGKADAKLIEEAIQHEKPLLDKLKSSSMVEAATQAASVSQVTYTTSY